jgi:hypothetical protein
MDVDSLAIAYLTVKSRLIDIGFAAELDWQHEQAFVSRCDERFLAEYAWVVLSCGLSGRIVSRVFPELSIAFCGWNPLRMRKRGLSRCVAAGRKVFDNVKKLSAISYVATVLTEGANSSDWLRMPPDPEKLRRLPFIGPVTALHLAKNLGADVSKPDRHLVRLAATLQYENSRKLCETIAARTGERVAVVDLVLWRYLSLTRDYALAGAGSLSWSALSKAQRPQ